MKADSKQTSGPRGRLPWPPRPLLVGALLLVYAALSFSAACTKCNTFDETTHLTNGYTFWATGDFRMIPEAMLIQRWLALPIWLSGFPLPPLDQPIWQYAKDLEFADQFFYEVGNDAEALLWRGRVMNTLLGIMTGLLVYCWSARLFGPTCGLVSLVLFAFSPTMLAHGSLITIDMSAALLFTASTWALWTMLHRVSPRTVLVSTLLVGCFFVGKLTAVLMIPIGLLLLAVRLVRGGPLQLVWGRRTLELADRRAQLAVQLGLVLLHALVAWGVVWLAFNCRFPITRGGAPLGDPSEKDWWSRVASQAGVNGLVLDWMHKHRLLPEAYLLAAAHTSRFTRGKEAFLNGQSSEQGWRIFFPYCLLVKTPLAVFAALLLALGAAGVVMTRRRQRDGPAACWAGLYRLAPLLVWLAVYWLVAIFSSFNIGHRHIVPTYPAMQILAGGAGWWLARPPDGQRAGWRWMRFGTVAVLVALAVESVAFWPNYLAYFNQLVGGPRHGYKHLIDSSLDWGQDLPALKRWLRRRGLEQGSRPVYLAYFGTARPEYYGIRATLLPHGLPGWRIQRAAVGARLAGGVYCISATIVQSNGVTHAYGRWTAEDERIYWDLVNQVQALGGADRSAPRDPAVAIELGKLLWRRDRARLGRLVAYLRQHCQPDDQINYSILVYVLTDRQVHEALFGPAPELGRRP